MRGKIEPQVDRRELGELPQRPLDPPCRAGLCGPFRGLDSGQQVHIPPRVQNLLAGIQGGFLAAQIVQADSVQLPQILKVRAARHTHSVIGLLFAEIVADRQLDQVQQRVRVTGKHTAAAGPVHAPLASLTALAVMVAVDYRTA